MDGKMSVQSKTRNYGKLGKRVEIGALANTKFNEPGYNLQYFIPSVEIEVGIGKNHVARLVMSKTAWEALNKGAKPSITTLTKFKKEFL